MRVVSSHGAEFSTALTRTSMGFFPVRRLIISKAFLVRFMTLSFFPALLPGRIRLFMNRSIMLTSDLWNLPCSCLPMLWGTRTGLIDT